MNTRALIFSVWVNAGKDLEDTVLAFENMASGQVQTYIKGGKTMISTSVGSEQFSYQLSGTISAESVQIMAYEAWRRIRRFSDESEFLDWIGADEVDSLRVSFDRMTDI